MEFAKLFPVANFINILISLPYKNSGIPIPMQKETIILLDQEANTQWALKTWLESGEYEVIPADTIEKALRNFSELEVSGLITEYWIDDAPTIETIRRFKKLFPEAYVMMLTDVEMQEKEYEKIIDAGTDDCFLKPFSMKKILLHLLKGLKQRQNLMQKKRMAEELNRISPGKSDPG